MLHFVVTQLVLDPLCNQGVVGSNPIRSIIRAANPAARSAAGLLRPPPRCCESCCESPPPSAAHDPLLRMEHDLSHRRGVRLLVGAEYGPLSPPRGRGFKSRRPNRVKNQPCNEFRCGAFFRRAAAPRSASVQAPAAPRTVAR